MTTTAESREQRLGRQRAWARAPLPMALDAAALGNAVALPGSGVARPPVRGVAEAVRALPGGAATFHSSCDAGAATTISFGPGVYLGQTSVLCVFWGSAWNSPGLNPGVGDIYAKMVALSDRTSDTFGSFGYFDALSDYSAGNQVTWGIDLVAPAGVIATSPPNNPFSLADVGNLALGIFNTAQPPPWNVYWDLVLIFMPPGYTPSGPQGEHSYINDSSGNPVNFAYVSYGGGANALANITFLASHELVEAMTDPHGDGWQINPRNASSWNEIGDACCSAAVYNGVTVTSYFSSSANACVVPSPPPPPLPPGDYLIDRVRKVDGRYIQAVSGPGNGQGRWVLPEFDVVAMIEQGLASFHTEVDGVRAEVGVTRWYLETVADDFLPNNLDNLPGI